VKNPEVTASLKFYDIAGNEIFLPVELFPGMTVVPLSNLARL
jgi:hypothetical protein